MIEKSDNSSDPSVSGAGNRRIIYFVVARVLLAAPSAVITDSITVNDTIGATVDVTVGVSFNVALSTYPVASTECTAHTAGKPQMVCV